MDRLPNLLSGLPYDALLDLAVGGCRADATTYRLASRHFGKRLPMWCVERVLLSTDLVPCLLTSVSICDGSNAALVCKLWAAGWRAETCRRKLPVRHVYTVGPELPVAPANRSFTVALHRPCFACELPRGDIMLTSEGNGLMHIRSFPDLQPSGFEVLELVEKGAGDVDLQEPTTMACVGEILYVFDNQLKQLFSFAAADLTRLSASEPTTLGDWIYSESFVAAGDCLLMAAQHKSEHQCKVVVLDPTTLEQRSTLIAAGAVDLAFLSAMAVLGDELFISTRGNTPHACIHVFSLAGEWRRTVNLNDVGNLNDLVSAHGRLYATEYAGDEGGDVEEDRDDHPAVWGRRLLVLSAALEVIHTCQVPGEDVDLFGICSVGDRMLLVADYDHHKLHVVAAGPSP